MNNLKGKLLPFFLTGFVFLADQITKTIIIRRWPTPGNFWTDGVNVFGDIIDVFSNNLLWIIHVRNTAIAFSLGENLPAAIQPVLFIILPILVLIFLLWYYFYSDEFTNLQRWAIAGIVGGGIGNIFDRIFAPGGVPGVVDFISVRFFGIFGWERWPTFNVADSAVVVCCIILFITILAAPKTKAIKK